MPPPLNYIRAGILWNTNSASPQPMFGVERHFTRNFGLVLHGTFDPRDQFLGATLRPSLLVHPNNHVNISAFIELGSGYYLNSLRARGGTEGFGINSAMGAEICPQVVSLNIFCTSISYKMKWIEQSVLRRTPIDEGWYFDQSIELGISIGFNI